MDLNRYMQLLLVKASFLGHSYKFCLISYQDAWKKEFKLCRWSCSGTPWWLPSSWECETNINMWHRLFKLVPYSLLLFVMFHCISLFLILIVSDAFLDEWVNNHKVLLFWQVRPVVYVFQVYVDALGKFSIGVLFTFPCLIGYFTNTSIFNLVLGVEWALILSIHCI